MRNVAITGTSGVGKSFLEQVLAQEFGFVPLTKYLTREARIGEKDVVAVSLEGYEEMKDEFFFTCTYAGIFYGWLERELEDDVRQTIAVPLEDMRRLLEGARGELFVPIFLYVKMSDVEMLVSRMKKREKYDQLVGETRNKVDKKIAERIALMEKDLERNEELCDLVHSYGGDAFEIVSDETLFNEVIPFILKETS